MPSAQKKRGLQEPAFAVAWGKHVGAIDPAQSDEFKARVEFSRTELIELLTSHRARKHKDGPYITRPMKGEGTRSDENADDWSLVPVDIDEMQAGDFEEVLRWCEASKLSGCIATTFSHRPDRPKLRYWLFASRPIKASEHAFVHRALSRLVPFKLDPCMNKPSQPVFLPACPEEFRSDAFSKVIDGEPLDVDRLLDGFRDEMEEEQRRRAERMKGVGTGVRQPGGLIDFFNHNFDLSELLEKHGYKRKGRNRYVAPGSRSRRAALVLYDYSLISFHDPAHDPLAVRNKFGQGMVLDAFAAYCKLEHADDFKAGFNNAAKWARTQGWVDVASSPSSKKEEPREKVSTPPPLLLNPAELYSNLRPQDMLVEGVLDQGSVVIASGDSNSGKTTILQLLGLQIAAGTSFASRRTKQGRVLWIAGEDMENAKYRMVAMCEEYQIDPLSIGDDFLLLPQPVAILDESSMQALREAVETRVGAGVEFLLIIVDSKSVNWGGVDENSNDENAMFIAAVRRHLIEPFGNPSVLITHHLTKQRDKESRSSRGGGSLINNADHEWRFTMNQEARLSAMMPGSKVRMERWAEHRFSIKTVELPAAKFPQLRNNFGEMPRISIAEPVNQYNKSMRDLQQETEMRAALSSLQKLTASNSARSLSNIATDLDWLDPRNQPDYRKVKRVLDAALAKKLVDFKDKRFEINEAGERFVASEVVAGNQSTDVDPDSPSDEREPGSDDE